MAIIGQNCEIILDSSGYYLVPGSYSVKTPRISKATYRADGSLAYVDLGPGKRLWKFVVIAKNQLANYDGTLSSTTGEQIRSALKTSYAGVGTTINYSDPINATAVPVYFILYSEKVLDFRSQVIALSTGGSAGASYEIEVELLEA